MQLKRSLWGALVALCLCSATGRAQEKPDVEEARRAAVKGPFVKISIKKYDLSTEITNVPREGMDRKRLPRRQVGYEDLRGALWSGGTNAVAALLSMGADPNAL